MPVDIRTKDKPATVLIMGAAGRDFHNFNVVFRDDPQYRVVAFTAAQIPNITGRRYPAVLAGPLYPDGIPIVPEAELRSWIETSRVDEVVFSYSDVSHEEVMHHASRVLAAGADFRLLGPRHTMLRAAKPVVSVCAVRTGAGKSPAARRIAAILKQEGMRVVVVRHPMPYGDLAKQTVQRFARLADLDEAGCTIEEREEYEPHLREGTVVYAGVDYERILRAAEQEADVLLWDGGNNDFPFFAPALEIVLLDPHRCGHERRYHPGEVNLLRAGVIVLTKLDTAGPAEIETARAAIMRHNPDALIVESVMPLSVEDPNRIKGKRVLVIEDGPTLTHGGMTFGAGVLAAKQFGAAAVVDPRPAAVGSIAETYREYPHLGAVLPAMGYGAHQLDDLAKTIANVDCETVLVATPVDLGRLMPIPRATCRVSYELRERGRPTLRDALARIIQIKKS